MVKKISILIDKLIREITGQTKLSDMVREDVSLTAGLANAARAAQAAYRAGNKEGYAEAMVRVEELLKRKKALKQELKKEYDKMDNKTLFAEFKVYVYLYLMTAPFTYLVYEVGNIHATEDFVLLNIFIALSLWIYIKKIQPLIKEKRPAGDFDSTKMPEEKKTIDLNIQQK